MDSRYELQNLLQAKAMSLCLTTQSHAIEDRSLKYCSMIPSCKICKNVTSEVGLPAARSYHPITINGNLCNAISHFLLRQAGQPAPIIIN